MSNLARLGAVLACLAVIIGAFGAHGLKDRLAATGQAANFETGARYHMYHALALLAVAGVLPPGVARRRIGIMATAAVVLFSGSLYVLALTGWTELGMVTPFGGLASIIAFAMVARAAKA